MESTELNNLVLFETENYTYNEKRIWNPNSFIALSIVFSFLPAAILYSLNYGRLGYSKKRNILMISSISIFVIIVTLATITKPEVASIFTPLNIALGIFFQNSQKELYKKHLEQGGKKASYVLPMTIILLVCGFCVFAMIYSMNIPQNMKLVNGDELYYTDSVSAQELEELEKYLIGYQILWNDDNQISVKIDKSQDVYKLSFIIDQQYINDKETMDFLKSLGQGVSESVYNNKKVVIQYCDNTFKVIKTLE